MQGERLGEFEGLELKYISSSSELLSNKSLFVDQL